MKKIISFIITIAIVLGIPTSIYAAGLTAQERIAVATPLADELKKLELFYGTDKGYELEKATTRGEGLIMLIRLLGEENTAYKSEAKHPFNDVPDWAKKYVSFAYANNLTSGISATKFGFQNEITATQYISFVLRALGYKDGSDFNWNESYILAEKIGLINVGEYRTNKEFIRADVVIISHKALDINFKNSDETLRQRLLKNGSGNRPDPHDQEQWFRAGVFIIPIDKRILVDKEGSLTDNRQRFNGVIGNYCNLRFFSRGIAMNNDEKQDTAIITQHNDGRFGIKITHWRKSYDSSIGGNEKLNMVLDAMYFLTGDEDVALALWKWVDAIGINGRANSDDFGFTDIGYNGDNLIIKMNNVQIEIEKGSGSRTYWFTTP